PSWQYDVTSTSIAATWRVHGNRQTRLPWPRWTPLGVSGPRASAWPRRWPATERLAPHTQRVRWPRAAPRPPRRPGRCGALGGLGAPGLGLADRAQRGGAAALRTWAGAT